MLQRLPYDDIPGASVEILLSLIKGEGCVPALRWDVEITGRQCADLLIRVKPPIRFPAGWHGGTRPVLDRDQDRCDYGWRLHGRATASRSFAGDGVVTYVMEDGRQIIHQDFVVTDGGTWSGSKKVLEPHDKVDPFALRMGFTRVLFREQLGHIPWAQVSGLTR